ncbi:MAG: hypothetical protein RL514_2489 [Verrucomicrobiota bacterium]|jgi:hypothetical protein
MLAIDVSEAASNPPPPQAQADAPVHCAECGKYSERDAVTCAACGTHLWIKCNQCRAKNVRTAGRCAKCRHRLHSRTITLPRLGFDLKLRNKRRRRLVRALLLLVLFGLGTRLLYDYLPKASVPVQEIPTPFR